MAVYLPIAVQQPPFAQMDAGLQLTNRMSERLETLANHHQFGEPNFCSMGNEIGEG